MIDLSRSLYLFDVDGTLVRLNGAGRRALEGAFADVFSVPDAGAVMDSIRFDGNTDRAILQQAQRRLQLSEAEFAAGRRDFEASYLGHLERLVSGLGPECVLPGTVTLLETLEGRGAALGLLTGNVEAGARAKLAPFGLNRFFAAGAFGSEHADRGVLAGLARQRLESHTGRTFQAQDVFVVGDSVMDVRCGKAHGFRTVAVTTGWTARDVLAAEAPDHLVESLGELLESWSGQ